MELPAQKAVIDAVKEKAVAQVRERWGEAAATVFSAGCDQLIARAIPSAMPTVTLEYTASHTAAKGGVTVEFAINPLDVAGVKAPDGLTPFTIYARPSFKFHGNLKTGSFGLTRLKVDCGIRAGT